MRLGWQAQTRSHRAGSAVSRGASHIDGAEQTASGQGESLPGKNPVTSYTLTLRGVIMFDRFIGAVITDGLDADNKSLHNLIAEYFTYSGYSFYFSLN